MAGGPAGQKASSWESLDTRGRWVPSPCRTSPMAGTWSASDSGAPPSGPERGCLVGGSETAGPWHKAFRKAELTLPGVGSACRAPQMLLPDRDHPLPSQVPQATVLE